MFHVRPLRIPFVLLETSWNYLICCLHHTDPRSVAFANIYLFTQVHLVFDLSYFYASAFRRRWHYVFGLSVRPSVRPKPEIPSFDLYMGPLVHPTNRNRFTACPSVRPSVRRGFRAFAGERMEEMAWEFTCWCILTIFRTDKFTAMVCWFF